MSNFHHSFRINLEPTLLISTLAGSVQGSTNTIGLHKFEKTTAIVSITMGIGRHRTLFQWAWSFHYSIPFYSTVPFHRSIPLNKDTRANYCIDWHVHVYIYMITCMLSFMQGAREYSNCLGLYSPPPLKFGASAVFLNIFFNTISRTGTC